MKPCLCRFPPDIYFQQDILPTTGFLRTAIDFLREVHRIYRMNEVESTDHGPYLPPLQLPDKMPVNRCLGEHSYFRQRFLYPIFAQNGQAGAHTFRNMFNCHGLGRGDEPHRTGRTSSFFLRQPNLRQNRLNAFCDRFRDERFHGPLAGVAAAHSANRSYSSGSASELAESHLFSLHR